MGNQGSSNKRGSKNDRRNEKRMRALTRFANSIGLEGPVSMKDQQLMRLKMKGRVGFVTFPKVQS